ncbi:levansucrase, partial [Fructobacillus tropaeoli]
YEDGQLFTGFRYYMGTYYWFVDGVRQNAGWRQAWGLTYYTDQNGRAVQGQVPMYGTTYDFGNDGTYYLRIPGTKTPTTPGFGGAWTPGRTEPIIPDEKQYQQAMDSSRNGGSSYQAPSQPVASQPASQPATSTPVASSQPAASAPAQQAHKWTFVAYDDKYKAIYTKGGFNSQQEAINAGADYMDSHDNVESYSYY